MANPTPPSPAPAAPEPAPSAEPIPPVTETPQTPPPVSPADSPKTSEVQPHHANKKAFEVAGLVIVVLIVAAVVGIMNHGKKNTPVAATSNKKDIPLFTVEYLESSIPKYPVSEQGYGADINIVSQMFEGLVQYQDETKIVPLLATSWTNPDQSTWIFNLRQNIKFHTGRTMTADDVKYTFDYIINHQNDPNGIYTNIGSLSNIKSVDVVSPSQVKITTTQPDPFLLNEISFIGIVDSKATPGSYDSGTGPYVVKTGTTPSDTDLDLVAANDYWGGHVYTRELKFHIETDITQIKKDAIADSYDLTGDFTDSVLKYYKVPYIKIDVPSLGSDDLILNLNRAGSPLQSLAAREAIDYAINRPELLTKSGIEGEPLDQIIPLSLPGHDSSIKVTPFDLTRAKQLLSTVKNANTQLTLGVPISGLEDQAIASYLDAAGFNIKIEAAPDTDTYDNNVNNGVYDISLINATSGEVDGSDLLTTDLTGTKNYDNPQIDSLLNQLTNTYDSAKRIKLMQQVDAIVSTDKPVIPISQGENLFVLTKPNYVVKVDQPFFSSSIYFWKAYQK